MGIEIEKPNLYAVYRDGKFTRYAVGYDDWPEKDLQTVRYVPEMNFIRAIIRKWPSDKP